MKKDEVSEINCSEALKLVAAFVDNQSGERDAKTLEKHIESCKHCFDRVEFEKLFKSRLRGLKLDTSALKPGSKARKLLEDL